MTRQEQLLADALKRLASQRSILLTGQVKSVNDGERTADVVTPEGLELFDVQLQVLKGLPGGGVVFPAVGATLLMVEVAEGDFLAVACDNVEKVNMVIDDVKLTIDAGGYLIKRGSETMQKLLSDLIDTILAMKVTTNTGVTINLVNAPDFVQLKPRITELFKSE